MIQSKTNNHLYGLYSFAFSLKSYGISSTKEQVRKNKLFLQNEPNFRKSQINLSNYMTRDYVQMDTWSIRKKQSQTNPNKAKTNPILANKTPIRTQFKSNLSCRSLWRSRNKPNFSAKIMLLSACLNFMLKDFIPILLCCSGVYLGKCRSKVILEILPLIW